MTAPRLEINLGKIRDNARLLVEMCASHGIEVAAVTKGVCALPPVVQAMLDGGVQRLCDSRVHNLRRLHEAGIQAPRQLIRSAMPSQVDDVVRFADVSHVTDVRLLRPLSEAAVRQGRTHGVLLMVELGGLREGMAPEALIPAVHLALELPGLEPVGVGTAIGCYNDEYPTPADVKQLVDRCEEARAATGAALPIVSGGSSSALPLLWTGGMPSGITQLRIGEAILLGVVELAGWSGGDPLPGAHTDTMRLVAEVIEVADEPIYAAPGGDLWRPAGRAIAALGYVDVPVKAIIGAEEGLTVIDATSDHLLLDTVPPHPTLAPGQEVVLRPYYRAMVAACASEYVEKVFIAG